MKEDLATIWTKLPTRRNDALEDFPQEICREHCRCVSLLPDSALRRSSFRGALRGASPKNAAAVLLHDADWNACNSFDAPDHVVPKPHPAKVEGSIVRLDLPRMSVATVTLAP